MNDKCTLSTEELIERCQDWVSKLARSGGRDWTLRVPVDFNNDPDMLFTELGRRLQAVTQPPSNTSVEEESVNELLALIGGACEGVTWEGDAKAAIKRIEGYLHNYRQLAASHTAVEEELTEVREWKNSAFGLIEKLHDYAEKHPDIQVGESKVEFVINRAKKYDELAASTPQGAVARETIEDVLLKTGKFNADQCSEIADVILKEIQSK